MLRTVKGMLALAAVAGLGVLLRWMTAGSISGVKSYDLESMTFLLVGTVAWIAYGWLVLAAVVTVLEQLPGVLGAVSSAVATRITTQTARTLLRSSFGVAAVTPLTVTAAQATPSHPTWPSVEPQSTIRLTAPTNPDWGPTEPPSTLHLTDHSTTPPQTTHQPHPTAPGHPTAAGRPTDTTTQGASAWGSGERGRTAGAGDGSARLDGTPGDGSARLGRVGAADRDPVRRVGVPDRPAVGAGVRYTDLRSGTARSVVVREGDTLWTLAARELGAGASEAAIVARWPEWYAANRAVIGPDPDLILPGQVLRVPPVSGAHVPLTQQEK
jgi:nucleoid-associated protein YgaU